MPRHDVRQMRSLLQRFASDDRGSMTIWGLFIFLCSGILGAFALDVTHLMASRTHLQVAADQAAHAALYLRNTTDPTTTTIDEIRTDAVNLVKATLPEGRYGVSLDPADINFGRYDTATRTWTEDNTSFEAARAETSFTRAKGNAAVTFLFRLIGLDEFNVSTESIFIAYGKACLREGFVANGIVDIQSNNSFVNGFCIHSNQYVSVNQRNSYERGTIVSMPNIDDLDIPGGIAYTADGEIDPKNFKLNEGLIDALTSGYIDIRVLNRIENMMYKYRNPTASESNYPNQLTASDTEGLPGFVNSAYATPLELSAKKITTEQIMAAGVVTAAQALASMDDVGNITTPQTDGSGRVYYIRCQGNSGLTIDASTTPLTNVVIMSPCEISFSNGSQIQNSRIMTSSTSADSISATNGLIVGTPGSCNGGAQFITQGGIRIPSGLEMYGSQMIAKGNIQFAANANGMTGASMIAGGTINGTSNGNMGLCGSGMGNNVELTYFRMVL